jgi:hypothetical protein
MNIYSEIDSEFFILDYTPSHSQILLRSKKNKNRDYNIDIFFKGISLIFLPSKISGIIIDVVSPKEKLNSILEQRIFESNVEGRVYSIITNENDIYYINATSMGIYHNKLDILQTSLGRYDYSDLDEFVLWDSNSN